MDAQFSTCIATDAEGQRDVTIAAFFGSCSWSLGERPRHCWRAGATILQESKGQAVRKAESGAASLSRTDVVGRTLRPHSKQVLHFWKAQADKPTPLLFFIHGGGWQAGNRMSGLVNLLPVMLKSGISVVLGRVPLHFGGTGRRNQSPVKAPLHDAARALQFVRSNAAEWNLDKQRVGASGGSAGACSSLWLAFHDDLADPKSDDPVARESSRLWCACP